MDPYERNALANLSMREKSHLKRRINREHNSNFRAGYININETYLHKTGLRGRKRYFLYCVVALLIFIALINALLTAGIMYALKFSYYGEQTMEFIPHSGLLRVMSDATFASVRLFDGLLGGRYNKSLVIESSKKKSVSFNTQSVVNPDGVSLSLKDNGTTVETSGGFEVTDIDSGNTIFSLDKTTTFAEEIRSVNLHVPSLETPVVSSTNDTDYILLQSFNGFNITGMEGTNLFSNGSVEFNTDRSIMIHSTEGSVTIDSAGGVYMDPKLPNVELSSQTTDPSIPTYRLCVCMPSGKIFTVPASQSKCDGVDPNNHPCL